VVVLVVVVDVAVGREQPRSLQSRGARLDDRARQMSRTFTARHNDWYAV